MDKVYNTGRKIKLLYGCVAVRKSKPLHFLCDVRHV